MNRFEECLAITLSHEGGWADHPSDPGGATMKGVTIGVFSQFKGRRVSKEELRAISDADLRTIYRRNYWDKVSGDELPPGLDLVAFDGAVNSGPAQGAKWLQRALGVEADGKIGPATVTAANAAGLRAVAARAAVNTACDNRLAMLQRLKTWPTFGRGWKRRVDDIRAKALSAVPDMPVIATLPPRQRPPEAASPVPAPSVAETPPSPPSGFLEALARILRRMFRGAA